MIEATTKEKLRRCVSAEELAGFMVQLRKDGIATPELVNAAAILKSDRGWE